MWLISFPIVYEFYLTEGTLNIFFEGVFFAVVPKCSTVIFIMISVFYSSASAPRDTSFIADYPSPFHMGIWVVSI